MPGDSNIDWFLANRFGIWVNGSRGLDQVEHQSDPWHAGHMNDVLVNDDGSLIAAADTGGVWSIPRTGQGATCLSDDWAHDHFESLAFGPDSPAQHVYAGGDSLYVTDLSTAVPLFNWVEITSLASTFGDAGTIHRVVVIPEIRLIALAADGGIYWSRIPSPPPPPAGCLAALLGMTSAPFSAADGYAWQKAIVNGWAHGGFYGLAPGVRARPRTGGDQILDSLIAGSLGVDRTDARGLFLGQWDATNTLIFERARIFSGGLDVSPIQWAMSRVSVTSFDFDRKLAYAAASDDRPDDPNEPEDAAQLMAFLKSIDGGATWQMLDTRIIGADKPTALTDAAGAQGRYNNALAVSPADPDIIAFGFQNGSFVSFDGGANWYHPTSDHLHEDVHGEVFAPFKYPAGPDANSVYVASDGGVARIGWGTGACVIESDYKGDGHHGDLVALVLEGNRPTLYVLHSNDIRGGWEKTKYLITETATGASCIIQSDFNSGDSGNKNFEVVVLEGNELNHYWADLHGGSLVWHPGGTISSSATGPGWIIQGNFGSGDHGNFEVVVQEGGDLVHYFKDNSNVMNPWVRTGVVSSKVTGPATFIQSNYPKDAKHGNFELVALEGSNLVHYWRDNGGPPYTWYADAQPITTNATGPGCIFKADYPRDADHFNFELIVQEGPVLSHWIRDNQDPALPWKRIAQITAPGHKATGPGCAFQGNYGGDEYHGNFELVAIEGGSVVHYWRDNAQDPQPWNRAATLTDSAFCFRSDYNRNLATLQFQRQSFNAGEASPGYGTLGVCSAVHGLIAGGTQDNGVLYGLVSRQPTPWYELQGGDGFGAVFLPAASLSLGALDSGKVLASFDNDETGHAPSAAYWAPASRTLVGDEIQSLPSPGRNDIIPLDVANPAQSPPPDSSLGLVTPRMEPVTAPQYVSNNDVLSVVAAKGNDIYGLFVGKSKSSGPDKIVFPMGWQYLGTPPDLTPNDPLPIKALGSYAGDTIFLGVIAQVTIMKKLVDVGRLLSYDVQLRRFTQMPVDPALASPVAVGITATGSREVFAITTGRDVIRWDGTQWTRPGLLPAGSDPLVAITADPSTTPAAVFVASGTTVFVSLDQGKTWSVATTNLPRTLRCSDLRWVNDDTGAYLYLATFGRSAWYARRLEKW